MSTPPRPMRQGAPITSNSISREYLSMFHAAIAASWMRRDKRYIQPVSHGVLFVGSYIKPRRSYLSNRTLARMEERCYGFRILFESGEVDGLLLSHIECVLNSYLGFCKRRRTYKRRRRLVEGMGHSFWQYFYVRGSFCSVRLRECYRQL